MAFVPLRIGPGKRRSHDAMRIFRDRSGFEFKPPRRPHLRSFDGCSAPLSREIRRHEFVATYYANTNVSDRCGG
jgi:hypothetical protein